MRYYLYLILTIVIPQFIYFFTDIQKPYLYIYIILAFVKESHRKKNNNYLDSIKYLFNLKRLGKIEITKNVYKELFLSFAFYIFGFNSIYLLITNRTRIQDVVIGELLLYILFSLVSIIVLFRFFFYNLLSGKEKK